MGDKVNIKGVNKKQILSGLEKLLADADKEEKKEIAIDVNVDDNASKPLKDIEKQAKKTSDTMSGVVAEAKNVGESITNSMGKAEKNYRNTFSRYSDFLKKLKASNSDITKANANAAFEDVLKDSMDGNAFRRSNSARNSLEKEVDKYVNYIEEEVRSAGIYNAEKIDRNSYKNLWKTSDLSKNLFKNENEVKESAQSFYKQLSKEKQLSSNEKRMVADREQLYAAFKYLEGTVDFNRTDFSNKDNNENDIKTLSKMVKIAKQIEFLDKTLGATNKEHTISSSDILAKTANFSNKMIDSGSLSVTFKKEYDEVVYIFNELSKYISSVILGEPDVSGVFAALESHSEATKKKVTKDMDEIKDSLSDPSKYITDNKTLKGSALNGWNRKNRAEAPKNLSKNTQYELVGQIANLERQGVLTDKYKSKNAYKYVQELITNNKEFETLYNSIVNYDKTKPQDNIPSTTPHSTSESTEEILAKSEALKELNEQRRIAQELGVEHTSSGSSDDSESTEEILAKAEALKKLNEERERENQLKSGTGKTNDQKHSTSSSIPAEAQKLIDEVNRLEALNKTNIFSGSGDINRYSNQNYRDVHVALSEYKQAIDELNKLKLEPQTDSTRKKIEELTVLCGQLEFKFQNLGTLNDATDKDHQEHFGYSDKDLDLLYSGKFKNNYEWINEQIQLTINQLQNQFPSVFNDLLSGKIQFNSDGINPFSGISEELDRIKAKGQETFDSIDVELMNSTNYVEQLKRRFNEIIKGNNGLGKYGDEVSVALRNSPELEPLKNATEFDDTKWKEFLSTLPDAHKYLQSIGYEFKEIQSASNATPDEDVYTSVYDILSKMVSLKKQFEKNKYEQQDPIYDYDDFLRSDFETLSSLNGNGILKSSISEEDRKSFITQIHKAFKEYKGIKSAVKNNAGYYKGTQYSEQDVEQYWNDIGSAITRYFDSGYIAYGYDDEEVLNYDINLLSKGMPKYFQDFVKNIADNVISVSKNNDLHSEEENRLEEVNSILQAEYDALKHKLENKGKGLNIGRAEWDDAEYRISSMIFDEDWNNGFYDYTEDDIVKLVERIVGELLPKESVEENVEADVEEDPPNTDKKSKRFTVQNPPLLAQKESNDIILGDKQEEDSVNTTAEVVDDAKKRQEASYREAADAAEESADRIADAEKKIQDAQKDNGTPPNDPPNDPPNEDINNRYAIKSSRSDNSQSITYKVGDFGRTVEEGTRINPNTNIPETFTRELTNMVEVENEAVRLLGKLSIAWYDLEQENRSDNPDNGLIDALEAKIQYYEDLLIAVDEIAFDLSNEQDSPFSYDQYTQNVNNRALAYQNEIDIKRSKQNKKESAKSKYTQEDIDKAKELFEGAKLGNATFDSFGKIEGSGKGTIKFIEKIGDEIKETIVYVNDLDDALNRLSDDTFDSKGLKQTFSTKNIEKATKNEADAKERKRRTAIDKLNKTEDEYLYLKAKEKLEGLENQEADRLKVLISLRKEYADALDEDHDGDLKDRYDLLSDDSSLVNDARYKKFEEFINKRIKLKDDNEWDDINTNDLIKGSKLESTYHEKFNEINAEFDNVKTPSLKAIEDYIEKIQALKKEINSIVKTDVNQENVKNEMIEYLNSISSSAVKIGEFNEQNKTLNATYKDQNGILHNVTLRYDDLGNAIIVANDKTKETIIDVESLTKLFGEGTSEIAKWILQFAGFQEIIQWIQGGTQKVMEFDKALIEMRKVSDESLSSLKNYQGLSFDIADEAGTTAIQIQNSTADFLRLGESLNEASDSSKWANTLLNISEFENIEDATSSLIAMSAAYDELGKGEIVDKLNIIGNNFSISTDGLATALQRSASALKTAGNDMDEAIALAVAGNQVVQDPTSVGAGLRTISLRITGTKEAKAELESIGEDTSDFVVQTAAKSQEKIKSFTKVASNDFKGFDILDENGNFKSTYEIKVSPYKETYMLCIIA